MLISAANCNFRRDDGDDGADGQPVPVMTVFKRRPDGTLRLHWASEPFFGSCDVSVGHESGTVLRIPLSWRLSGPRRLRAHPSRVKGASRRFAMTFGHP
jgi:hypothetical protein